MSSIRCPAKLNVSLAVGPRRADGFHELESLVLPIGLFDELKLDRRQSDHASDRRFQLTCDDRSIPTDDTNLVLRAATALASQFPETPLPALTFALRKRIPAGAGLGGGSSDAVGALKLLKQFAGDANMSAAALATIAAGLGSDVPFFLVDGPAIMRGRGEALTPIRMPFDGWAVVALPPIHCSTAAVYAAFDALPAPSTHEPADALLQNAHDGEELHRLGSNDLQEPAFRVAPALRETHALLNDLAPFRVTGSGSALFTLVSDEARATRLADLVRVEIGVRCETAPILG